MLQPADLFLPWLLFSSAGSSCWGSPHKFGNRAAISKQGTDPKEYLPEIRYSLFACEIAIII